MRLVLLAGVLALIGANVYRNLAAPESRPLEVAPAVAAGGPAPIAAAHDEVEVVMYSTSWCGYCRAARAWLHAHGVTYVDHDVEREPAAHERHAQLSPRGGVPVFEIDGRVLHGFDAIQLERAIQSAAAQRRAVAR
jgi:glutaredoxin